MIKNIRARGRPKGSKSLCQISLKTLKERFVESDEIVIGYVFARKNNLLNERLSIQATVEAADPKKNFADIVLPKISKIEKEFSDYFKGFYLKECKFYREKREVTGKDFERLVGRIFSKIFKNDFESFSRNHKKYDIKVCGNEISIKGANLTRREDGSYFFTITQSRTTTQKSLDEKIANWNSSMPDYELCCLRYLDPHTFKFRHCIFIFSKSIFAVKDGQNFGEKKSIDLNDLCKFSIGESASSQISIRVSDLNRFLAYSGATILYNDVFM